MTERCEEEHTQDLYNQQWPLVVAGSPSLSPAVVPLQVLMLASSPCTASEGCTCFGISAQIAAQRNCVSVLPFPRQPGKSLVWLRPSQQLWPICMHIFSVQKLPARLCTAHWLHAAWPFSRRAAPSSASGVMVERVAVLAF